MAKRMKKFLIIGNMNAIAYKEIFPLIKDNKIWLGVHNKIKGFISDDGGIKNISNVYWYTNMEHNKRKKSLELTKSYDPALYPKYDNYNAIEVSKVSDIPMDYAGVMGVPVTFLEKYSPTQFEIIGEANHGKDNEWDLFTPSVDGKTIFKRILIRRKI